jgi:hypothetical protein
LYLVSCTLNLSCRSQLAAYPCHLPIYSLPKPYLRPTYAHPECCEALKMAETPNLPKTYKSYPFVSFMPATIEVKPQPMPHFAARHRLLKGLLCTHKFK